MAAKKTGTKRAAASKKGSGKASGKGPAKRGAGRAATGTKVAKKASAKRAPARKAVAKASGTKRAAARGGAKGGGAARGTPDVGAKGELPAKGTERIWGTLPQCLRWLEEAGYSLSPKNAHAHYGKSASNPVRRDKRGRWHFPEFLERVRVNHGAQAVDYDTMNKVAAARQMAELRIKNADAKRKEMLLAEKAGELVPWAVVKTVVVRAMKAMQTEGKAKSFSLPEQMEGKPRVEQTRVIQDAFHEVFGKMSQVFQEMGRGE